MNSTNLRAIVFDTSAYGGGNFDYEQTKRWAEACEAHGCELWLPEPVVWELAEHAIRDDENHLDKANQYNRARKKLGQTTSKNPAPLTLDDFTTLVEDTGADMIPLEGEDARAAVRDQLLQVGPGSRVKNLKTGAGDSAWLRCVLRHNSGTFDDLVIVSGDTKAINAVVEEEGIDPPNTFERIAQMSAWLEDSRPATSEETEAATEVLLEAWVVDGQADLHHALTDLRLAAVSVDLDAEHMYDWERQDRTVHASAELLVRENPAPQFNPWAGSVRLSLSVPVSVIETYVGFWPDEDDPLPMRQLVSEIVAEFDADYFVESRDIILDFDRLTTHDVPDTLEVHDLT